jgi:hypothetical protein
VDAENNSTDSDERSQNHSRSDDKELDSSAMCDRDRQDKRSGQQEASGIGRVTRRERWTRHMGSVNGDWRPHPTEQDLRNSRGGSGDQQLGRGCDREAERPTASPHPNGEDET